ncbi:hypothetical protein OG936_37870 [Streptomyces sp. NBC_00846]|nr:hypothetical protein OG936_37870 [Streptomyces sp. NBC_00846]
MIPSASQALNQALKDLDAPIVGQAASSQLRNQGVQLRCQSGVFSGQVLDASRERAQGGQDRDMDRVVADPEPDQGVDALVAPQHFVLRADAVGRGDQDVSDLVQRRCTGLDGGSCHVVQSPDPGDGIAFGGTGGPAGHDRTSCGIGVDRIGLADPAALGLVRPVDFDHGQIGLAGRARKPRPVGGRALHADGGDGAVSSQEGQSSRVSGGRCGELGIGDLPTAVGHHGNVDSVGMRVHAADHHVFDGCCSVRFCHAGNAFLTGGGSSRVGQTGQ